MNMNRNILRWLSVGLLPLLSISNLWGNSSYYTAFTATSEDTGKGLVYASGPGTSTAPENDSDFEGTVNIGQSENTSSSSGTNTYYAWAKAARGFAFNGWTISSPNNGVSPTSSNTQNGVAVTVTSNVADGTNTGTATAKWIDDPNPYTVTFGVPQDGSYTVSYSYKVIENGKFVTETSSFSMTESSTAASGQKISYAGDTVTLSTDATNFDGWYNNGSFTGSALSTETSYSFIVNGATSIYAKFKPATKYYGRIIASIPSVPYSMPGGGTIYISDVAGTAGAVFSEEEQSVSRTTYNSENTPPASVNQTYYLHAKPNDKRYVFRGWYDNAQGTGTALSTDVDWEYTFAVSSHTESSPTTQTIYACFDFNLYYMQVDVQPATPGLGMVLASDQQITPDYTQYSNLSSQFTYSYRLAPTANVYLYAKPKYGYKFSGWYNNPECSGNAVGTANPLTYAATGTSTNPLSPDTIRLYAKFVEETKINITYTLPDQTKGQYKAYVLDIEEIDDEFVWMQHEIYTSVDKSSNTTQEQYKTDVLILDAEPGSGYGVTAWNDNGTTKTTPSHIYQTTATAAKTVAVTFGEALPFLVSTSTSATTGTAYSTLAEALQHVSSGYKITVVQNAFVPAGNYTIPNGVTLLVPYDENYAVNTNQPTKESTSTKPTAYSKLTLGDGVSIVVQSGGAICVNAKIRDVQNTNGAPFGGCGVLEMTSGSQIELQSGANLYSWGWIIGDGNVLARNGSNVYESLQANDYPGGTFLSLQNSTLKSKKIFPVRIYCVPNIQVKLKLEYGATEKLATAFASLDLVYDVAFVTVSGSTNGLFQLKSGSTVTKWYDKVTDRQRYLVDGDAILANISLKVQSSVTVNSKDYVLPLTHNMQIDIISGTTTINSDVELLPGAKVIVGKEATVDIKSGASVYVYDVDEWNINHTFAYGANKSIIFGRTQTMSYAKADLSDALFEVAGKVMVNGALYTTSSGGDIKGLEGGCVQVNAFGSATFINQVYEKGSTSQEYHTVDVVKAKLHNGDGSYVETASGAVGDRYYYSESLEKWMKNPKTITWNANGGTTDASVMAYSEGAFLGELPAAYRDGYTLDGWFTAASGGTQISQTTKVTATTTYYAHWTAKVFNIDYKDQGKAAFSGTHVDNPSLHPTTHTYGTATTLNDATKPGNIFGGWHTISNCKDASHVTSLDATAYDADITLYAKWTPIDYTIAYTAPTNGNYTISVDGGTASSANKTANYGQIVTLSATPDPGYVLASWTVTKKGGGTVTVTGNQFIMPDDNVTITANFAVDAYYTITIKASPAGYGSVSEETISSVPYGSTVTIEGNTLTIEGPCQ